MDWRAVTHITPDTLTKVSQTATSALGGLDSPDIVEGSRDNPYTLVLENSQRGPVLVNHCSPLPR